MVFGAAAGLVACAAHAGPGAHVHGKAELDVAIDGPQLEIRLSTPLDGLVGFEHAPRNDRQRAAAQAAVERLRKPEHLFTPTPAAGCTPAGVTLASSALPADVLGTPASTQFAAGPDSGHADLDGVFVFRCASPERLQGMDVGLLKAFPGIRQLKVNVAGPRGQTAATVVPSRTGVRW